MALHNISGRAAEEEVAKYLSSRGYKILDRNWKNRWGEIDIIAERNNCVHFVEVKYRTNNEQGSGLDYITPAKLRQMGFAAEMWINSNGQFEEFVLSAAEVSGPDFDVEFIEGI